MQGFTRHIIHRIFYAGVTVISLALIFIPSPVFSQQVDAFDVLQKGHKAKRGGNIEEAIKFYKKAIEIKPNYKPAKFSLKSALQLKSISDGIKEIAPNCVKPKNAMDNKRCAQEYFVWNGQPIHPKIVEDLVIPFFDKGDQIISINLEFSQDSNRYCCKDNYSVKVENGLMLVSYLRPSDEGFFSYQFKGKMDNGVFVIRTWNNTGGSGVFGALLFLKITERASLRLKGDRLLVFDRKHVVLEKLGEWRLGDRKRHGIKVDKNSLYLDGKIISITPNE